MRVFVFLAWAALAACSGSTPQEGPGGEPAAAAPSYHSTEELHALGSVRPLDEERTLLCGGEPDSGCVCLEPLPCEASGDCISFDENVETFRAALAAGQDGRTVQCDRAEIGRCGGFRYFDFQGDLERRELRWFDESGALVGQRNVADYKAYCEGQARVRLLGRLPKCGPLSAPELICGEAANPLFPPDEDLRRFLAGPLQPGPAGQP